VDSLSKPSPWLQAFIILALISVTFFIAESLYGFLLRDEFKIFVFYAPAALSLAVYLYLKFTVKGRERRA
jgi:hypothetical protein